MSPAEAAYRMAQQASRFFERFSAPNWTAFGAFRGNVSGLPGLRVNASTGTWTRLLANEAQATLTGRFTYLGRTWPILDEAHSPWWDTDVWLLDPVSRTPWPGRDCFAFDAPYREEAARGDVKFVWELNRLQCLPPLALYAVLTEDRAAAAVVFDILRGWMRGNPPSRGVNWISGVEAASRLVSLLSALAFIRPLTIADAATVRTFLQAHLHWIVRHPSRFSSANNHRVAELAALFLGSICAPGLPRAGRLARRAQAGLEREMLRLFHNDGVGAEQAVFYAAYSLEWFALAGEAAEAVGRPFSTAYRERASRALDHLRWLLDEGGQTPRIGDADDGRVLALTQGRDPHYALSVAAMTARWLGEPGPASVHRPPALQDLIGKGRRVSAAPTGSRTFDKGGLTVWRRPRPDGALLLVFDHGPLGYLSIAAHGHADALAVWLHWGDEAVFADPGTGFYHADGKDRDALRGTAAHNTLSVSAADQSRIVGPFAWADHADARLVRAAPSSIEAEHDGYVRRFGLTHRRRVQVGEDEIIIEDRLLGRPKASDLQWSVGYTLAPGVETALDGDVARLRTPGGRWLRLVGELQSGPIAWTATRAPYAPAFGNLDATTRLELSGMAAPELMIRTRIILGPESDHQPRPT